MYFYKREIQRDINGKERRRFVCSQVNNDDMIMVISKHLPLSILGLFDGDFECSSLSVVESELSKSLLPYKKRIK
jgi:hypothetical protein